MRSLSLCLSLLCLTGACAPARSQEAARSGLLCREVSADTTLQLVQRSEAFRFAVRALSEAEAKRGVAVDDAQIDRLCAGMVKETPALLGGVSLIQTAAVYDTERSFMIFAVHDGRVLVLNPRPDGRFRFGLQSGDWNAFLASASLFPSISDAGSAREYACLLLRYLGNYMPGDPCGSEEAATVDRIPNAGWKIEFPRFRWKVEVSENGRVARS